LSNTEIVCTFFKNDSTFKIIKAYEIFVPPVPPTLNLNAPDSTEYGTSVVVEIASNGDSINVNPPNLVGFNGMPGSYSTPSLTESVTYNVTAYGEGGQTNASLTIGVNPLPTYTDLFCMHPFWRVDSMWDYIEETWDYVLPGDATIYTQALTFFPDGNFEVWRFPECTQLLCNGCSWYFLNGEENQVYWPDEDKNIISLTSEEFVCEYYVAGIIPVLVRIKYVPYYSL
jgi:hypothetical protein